MPTFSVLVIAREKRWGRPWDGPQKVGTSLGSPQRRRKRWGRPCDPPTKVGWDPPSGEVKGGGIAAVGAPLGIVLTACNTPPGFMAVHGANGSHGMQYATRISGCARGELFSRHAIRHPDSWLCTGRIVLPARNTPRGFVTVHGANCCPGPR